MVRSIVADDDAGVQWSRHLLQPCRQVGGIANGRELQAPFRRDITGYDRAEMDADCNSDRIKSSFTPADVPRILFGDNGAGGGDSADSVIWFVTRGVECRHKTIANIFVERAVIFKKLSAPRAYARRRKPITLSGGSFSVAFVKSITSANSTAASWDVITSKGVSWSARSSAIFGAK